MPNPVPFISTWLVVNFISNKVVHSQVVKISWIKTLNTRLPTPKVMKISTRSESLKEKNRFVKEELFNLKRPWKSQVCIRLGRKVDWCSEAGKAAPVACRTSQSISWRRGRWPRWARRDPGLRRKWGSRSFRHRGGAAVPFLVLQHRLINSKVKKFRVTKYSHFLREAAKRVLF